MTLAPHDSEIETERLILRRMTTADLPFYTRIHADPDVAQYIGLGRPRTVDETRVWLETILKTYEAVQLGQLAVVRKSDGALIGRCGLGYFEIDPLPFDGGQPIGYFVMGEAPRGIATHREPELGYTFARTVWGQGFAREAAGAVFSYATSTLKADPIVSIIHPDNVRSQRVARSFGAMLVDRIRAFNSVLDRYRWPHLATAPTRA